MPRHQKRVVLLLFDIVALYAVLWSVMSLRLGCVYWPETPADALVVLAAPAITAVSFVYAGLYRVVTRYLGARGHTRIAAAISISILVWSLIVLMSRNHGVPRSVIFTYGFFAFLTIILSRKAVGALLKSPELQFQDVDHGRTKHGVVIYGAGQAGLELAQALMRLPGRDVVGFCDQSPSLWGQYVGGIKVHRPERLARIIERHDVKEVLLALSSGDRHLRRSVLKDLENLPVAVNIMPSLEDIASGRVAVTDLRPLDVADLLGRECVQPIADLLARNTSLKNVLVTGAGGSIGSELVRQLLYHKPSRLILLDQSEPSLFEIEIEAREAILALPDDERPEIAAVLGSVLDALVITETINRYDIQTIYHAAAYKHVPMVEHNPGVGITNNVTGTEVVAEAAVAGGVERVVLISTDKAVRPTNVMGASKRLAELVLQARASTGVPTVFTMVRFGNVLDSSGSVVGRFRRQIKAGGPVTVTHPDVIRYFMSIPEAAELVIQAGAMAKGGEVFVLDMGEPVKIVDLARLMVRLSGLDVRDEANPTGDIEITYTGLRPGEKLYEELLIGGATTGTEHPRILRSHEPYLAPAELRRELEILRAAIAIRDMDAIQAVLMRTVEGYRPEKAVRTVESVPAANWVEQARTLH